MPASCLLRRGLRSLNTSTRLRISAVAHAHPRRGLGACIAAAAAAASAGAAAAAAAGAASLTAPALTLAPLSARATAEHRRPLARIELQIPQVLWPHAQLPHQLLR